MKYISFTEFVAMNRCIKLGIYSRRIKLGKIYVRVNLEVTCGYIITRIIRFPYVDQVTTCLTLPHFDRTVGCRHFEDTAGVAGNRCIKHGRNTIRLHNQTKGSRFFQDQDICKISSFPTSPAINDTLHAYRPSQEQAVYIR